MSNDESQASSDILGLENRTAASHSSIGYGRPPTKSQFKPGQSGNPRGRPKRRDTDLSVYLSNALDDKLRKTVFRKANADLINWLLFSRSWIGL